jgi:hypothetical protein
MVEFAADTTLEVRRNKRLYDVVSLVAPGVEVQTDETWMLPEQGTDDKYHWITWEHKKV